MKEEQLSGNISEIKRKPKGIMLLEAEKGFYFQGK